MLGSLKPSPRSFPMPSTFCSATRKSCNSNSNRWRLSRLRRLQGHRPPDRLFVVLARRDFECVGCGAIREAYAPAHIGFVCENVLADGEPCRRVMVYIFTLSKAQPPSDALWPMVHPHLGHQPVEVRSWGHYKSLLKQRNLSNELGS